jgi:hypothetical protein
LITGIIDDLRQRERQKRSAGSRIVPQPDAAQQDRADADDAGAVELPTLQLVCSELWKSSSGDEQLTMARYESLGRAGGIIERYVRDVMPAPPHDALTANLLLFLAPDSGYKQSYSCAELAAYTRSPAHVVLADLQRLSDARILRTRSFHGDERFELQHDAFVEVLRPWRKNVLKRLDREQRAARRLRRVATAAAAIAVVALLVGAPAWMVAADRREIEANTVGLLQPLRQLSENEAHQIPATMERVAGYLLFQRDDPDRFDRVRTLMLEYQDLLPPSYGVNYADLRLPPPSTEFTIEYSSSRAGGDDVKWRAGFLSAWTEYVDFVADRWGIPVPQVRLTARPEFPDHRVRASFAPAPPLWVEAPLDRIPLFLRGDSRLPIREE